jgi:hypothetical protein
MGKKTIPSSSAAGSGAKKPRGMEIPDVADMGQLSSGGQTRAKPVFDEQLHIGLYEYAKNGAHYNSEVFSENKLWVAQMVTGRQPNPLFQVRKVIGLYGQATGGTADPQPPDMPSFESRYHAVHQFVGKKTEDKDDVGWVKNRMGWYIDEDYVKEFIMYLDDLFDWRKDYKDEEFEKVEGPIKIVIHMLKSASLSLQLDATSDELKCVFEVVKEDDMMMSVFDLPPPVFPPRIVILTFQVQTPDKVHLVFSGNTKPFQEGFVKRGIKGRSVKLNPTDPYGEYLRVQEGVSLADKQACVDYLKDIFQECLQGSPVIVRVKATKFDLEKLKSVLSEFMTVSPKLRIEI